MNTTKENSHGTNRETAIVAGTLFILAIGGGGVFWATTIILFT
jgi:hypothetical protein